MARPQETFKGLYGQTLNFVTFKQAINNLDRWYHDRGILGQVRACTPFDDAPPEMVWVWECRGF